MTTERQKVLKRVNALLNKTVDRGCTEEEAMQAAQKAAELMEIYDIESTELDIKEGKCIKVEAKTETYGRKRLHQIAVPMARLFDCRVWADKYSDEETVVFFGFEHDAKVAGYIYETVQAAILNEIDTFRNSAEYNDLSDAGHHGRTIMSSFVNGITGRLCERIRDLARKKEKRVQERIEEEAKSDGGSSRALVALKQEKVNEEFDDLGMKLTKSYSRSYSRSQRAKEAGQRAADNVNLNGAVEGSGERKAITS